MRWGLLVSRRKHKPKQFCLSICRSLSSIPLNPIVPSNHHPGVRLFSQKRHPLHVISITATRQVFHMVSTVTKMLDESVKCAGENWGRAIIEEDLHAANR